MQTRKKYIFGGAAAVIIAVAAVIFYSYGLVRGAVYGWTQTDWSGGASTTATAAHPGDESGWTDYYSKDAVVSTSTPGEITLASTTAEWTETADADFNAGALSNSYATSGAVFLKKPTGASCALSAECTGGYCNASSTCDTCQDFTYSSQTYSVVTIGKQCWMAENLNVGQFATSSDTGSGHSDVSDNSIIEKYCYNNATSSCASDGGLYDWNEAMGYSTTEGAQGICPSGWHIPTDAEFYELENGLATGACSASRVDWSCDPAGTALKQGGSSGFAALLVGYRHSTGSFKLQDSYAMFWSSLVSAGNAWAPELNGGSTVLRGISSQTDGFSVRCLKD